MIKKYFLFFAVFTLSLFLGVGFSISHAKEPAVSLSKVFDAKSYVLENGLKIVVIENHRAPVVTHMVWYRAGSSDEPAGKSGIAHFLEHLMFKGQNDNTLGLTLSSGEFSRIVRTLGGEDNAFTSRDYTAYFQSVSKDHLEQVMTMEAGRMRGLNPPLEEVISENKVIQEERRQRTDNSPRAQLGEQMTEVLFANHPYAAPVIGWMHEIQSLTWDDAKAFYDLYYAPNNAVLVVSGDVTGEEVLKLAQKTYGLLPAAEVPERAFTRSPAFKAQTRVTLAHENVKEPLFTREYRVPSYRQDKTSSLALQVFEEIMGGGSTSRLYRDLVVDQKIATDVSLYYRSTAWDDATLSITVIPSSLDDLPRIEMAINDALRQIIKDGPSAEELSNAVTRLQTEAVYARDSLSGPAMVIGYSLITGSTLDDVEYWPHNIEKVTAEQIKAVATAFLNPDAPSETPPAEGLLLPKPPTKDK